MPELRIINGKEYQYVTKRNILDVSRKIARSLIAQGKDAVVYSINNRNHEVYIRDIKK